MNKGEELISILSKAIEKELYCDVAYYDFYKQLCDVGHYLCGLEKALDKATEIICKRCGCYDCEMGCSMPSVDKVYACDLERVKR